jgi:hypothetical protein
MTSFLWIVLILQVSRLLPRLDRLLGVRQALHGPPATPEVDVTSQKLPAPAELRPILESLIALGFRRLAEYQRVIDANTVMTSWYMAAPSGNTHVGVFLAGTSPMAVFVTMFGERAMVETAYPAGIPVTMRDYRSQVVSTSLADAYASHERLAQTFAARFGAPERVESADDCRRQNDIYDRRFWGRKARARQSRVLIELVSGVYGAVVIAGGIVANWLYKPDLKLLVLTLVALFIPAIITDTLMWASARIRHLFDS